MLNRINLEIAKTTAKNESRYSLAAVLVTPTETVATDGHRLTMVQTAGDEPADFAPFLLGRQDALDAAKRLPRAKRANPGDKLVAVDVDAAKTVVVDRAPWAAIACEKARKARLSFSEFGDVVARRELETPAGNFPDWRRVIPAADKLTATVTLDARYLRDVCDQVIALCQGEKIAAVSIGIQDAESGVRFDSESADGQHMVSVVMPRPDDAAETAAGKFDKRQADIAAAVNLKPGDIVRFLPGQLGETATARVGKVERVNRRDGRVSVRFGYVPPLIRAARDSPQGYRYRVIAASGAGFKPSTARVGAFQEFAATGLERVGPAADLMRERLLLNRKPITRARLEIVRSESVAA